VNEGSIIASAGATDVFGPISNAASGSIVAAGESTLVFYDDVTNAGLIEALPGSTLLFARDLALASAGTLAFDLAGLESSDDFADFQIGGTAQLSGAIDIDLAPGFVPAAGDTFTLLDAADGISGAFTHTMFASLPAGLSWMLDYSANNVTLRIAAATGLEGDYNGNGAVEQADLDLVLLNWGAAGSPPPAGWINDLPQGPIDQAELDGILLNWGNSAPGILAGSAVPEPAGVLPALLLAIGAWAMTARIGAAGTTPVSR
jgi:hypothetical protein